MKHRIRVDSYAGYKGDQEPRAIWLDGERHDVAGIGDRWFDPAYDAFRLRTESGLRMLVQRDRVDNEWYLTQVEPLDA